MKHRRTWMRFGLIIILITMLFVSIGAAQSNENTSTVLIQKEGESINSKQISAVTSDSLGSKEIWSRNVVDESASEPFNNIQPEIFKELIIVNDKNRTIAYNKDNGSKIWSTPTAAGSKWIEPETTLKNGDLLVSGVHKLYSLNPKNGEIKWEKEIASISKGRLGPPVIANDSVYVNYVVGEESGSSGGIRAFDVKTGNQEWNYNLSLSSERARHIGLKNSLLEYQPAVGNEKIYTVISHPYYRSENASLLAIEKDTQKLDWNYTSANTAASSPIFSDGDIFIAIDDTLYNIASDDGELNWNNEMDNRILATSSRYNNQLTSDGDQIFIGINGLEDSDDPRPRSNITYAIEAESGNIESKKAISDIVNDDYTAVAGTPVATSNAVYLTDLYRSTLIELDPDTGSTLFSSSIPRVVKPPLVTGNRAYYYQYDGALVAMELNEFSVDAGKDIVNSAFTRVVFRGPDINTPTENVNITWEQVSGVPVEIEEKSTLTPYFDPPNTDPNVIQQNLTFRITVTYGDKKATDLKNVTLVDRAVSECRHWESSDATYPISGYRKYIEKNATGHKYILVTHDRDSVNRDISDIAGDLDVISDDLDIGYDRGSSTVCMLDDVSGPNGLTAFESGDTAVVPPGSVHTMFHEYTHTRQQAFSYALDDSDENWVDEGSAEYYAFYYSWKTGHSTDSEYLSNIKSAPAKRLDTAGATSYVSYSKGATVLAALDIRIRQLTDGDKSLQDAFIHMRETDADLNSSVVHITNESTGAWLDKYEESSKVPPIPNNIKSAYNPNSMVVEFSYNPENPSPGERVNFVATNTYTADSTIESYKWDFDNDNEIDKIGKEVNKTFESTGEYPVTLIATNSDGNMTSTIKRLDVEDNSPPFARFEYNPSPVIAGKLVEFNASSSFDSGTEIVKYEWDFNDDLNVDEVGKTATHRFNETGKYTVGFEVEDEAGNTNYTTRVINVKSANSSPPEQKVQITNVQLSDNKLRPDSETDVTLTVEAANISTDGIPDTFSIQIPTNFNVNSVSEEDIRFIDEEYSSDPSISNNTIKFEVNPDNSSIESTDITVKVDLTLATR